MEETNKKVLIIEDDSFLRSLYKDKLEKEGFYFMEASNGVEGLHKIENEYPNIVILDILLPSKGGFEILEEMNKNGLIKQIPVIVLSNLKQDSDIEEARRLGAVDYFIKTESSSSEVVDRVKYFA